MPLPTKDELYRRYLARQTAATEQGFRTASQAATREANERLFRQPQPSRPGIPAPASPKPGQGEVSQAQPPSTTLQPTGPQPEPQTERPAARLTPRGLSGTRQAPPEVSARGALAESTERAERALERVPTYKDVPPGQVQVRRPDAPPSRPPRPDESIRVDPATTGERFVSAATSFLKAFPEAASSSLDAIRGFGKELEDVHPAVEAALNAAHIPASALREGHPVVKQVTEKIREFSEQLFPEDKILRDEFVAATVPAAIGSGVAFVTSAAATGGGAPAAGALGALQEAGSMYREAEEHGATPRQRKIALGAGAVLGATEAAGLGGLPGRVSEGATGGARALGRRIVEGMVREVPEETIQEAVQQTGENVTAGLTYDPTRKPFEGVKEAAGAAALSAGLIGGGGGVAEHVMAGRPEADRKSVV